MSDLSDRTKPALGALDTSHAEASELREDVSAQNTFLKGVRCLARSIFRSADSVVHATTGASTFTLSVRSQSILKTSKLIQEYTRLKKDLMQGNTAIRI